MRELGGRTEAGANARTTLAQSLMRAELTCPACSGKTAGAILETLWHDDVFWQVRSCLRCEALLVATTPVSGTNPGPTHCARLSL